MANQSETRWPRELGGRQQLDNNWLLKKVITMKNMTGSWMAALAMGVLAIVIAAPTLAQSADLEEIVVTARKRDESFRDVPITVSVFTEQAIQSAGIQKPGDFIAMIPNMTLVETQNAGNAFVTVRGISQARNSEPSVAVLVDGVLETNPAEFNQELFDISQIEVLKGPQCALYGRKKRNWRRHHHHHQTTGR